MIYLHVPFCRSFCTYCDFYSEIACRGKDAESLAAYEAEVLSEIDQRKDEILESIGIDTLYIGGGTPSVLPLAVLSRIVEALKKLCGKTGSWREFTVEVNPDDIVNGGLTYVEGLKQLGVNRISMGVQSSDDDILRWMGRRHDFAQAKHAVSLIREAGIENLSLDLIFGINCENAGIKLQQSIEDILNLEPDHISAYQLSIESGSALAKLLEEGKYVEASDEECRCEYELICTKLYAAGFEHYEISNWAKPGKKAIHNSSYWTRAPYVGLGPGAHSLRGLNLRSWNNCSLTAWRSSSDCSEEQCEHLSKEQILQEKIMLGLRTADGIETDLIDGAKHPLLESNGKRIRIPERHWFISDSIIEDLI